MSYHTHALHVAFHPYVACVYSVIAQDSDFWLSSVKGLGYVHAWLSLLRLGSVRVLVRISGGTVSKLML